MTIAVMSPSARAGDAVGFDALTMFRTLKQRGLDVVLLTPDGNDELAQGGVYEDARWRLRSADDLLIYHACTDDPDALKVIRALDCRVWIRFHNVTPPSAFYAYSDGFSRACAFGRAGLIDLVQAPVELFLCDSGYNAQDLAAYGAPAEKLRTLPPFHPAERLLAEADDPATLAWVTRRALNVLSVGRVVPNKRHDLALHALAHARRRLGADVHLHVVGGHDPRLADYHADLRRLVRALDLEDAVSFHPKTGAPALATYYRSCNALLTPSDHEGFGVPAVEAMAFGLPVVAAPSAALPETIGDAGLYGRDGPELGDALAGVLADEALRGRLKAAGERRFRERYAHAVLEDALFEALATGSSAGRGARPPADPDWFGLPAAVRTALEAAGADEDLSSLDAQRRVVERLMRSPAPETARLFGSEEMRRFAATAVTPFARHVRPPAAALAWTFGLKLQADFPLTDVEAARDYSEWFHRAGLDRYPALAPLLPGRDRAFADGRERTGAGTGG